MPGACSIVLGLRVRHRKEQARGEVAGGASSMVAGADGVHHIVDQWEDDGSDRSEALVPPYLTFRSLANRPWKNGEVDQAVAATIDQAGGMRRSGCALPCAQAAHVDLVVLGRLGT